MGIYISSGQSLAAYHLAPTPTKMYFAGMMDCFSASKIELIVWCSTFVTSVPSVFAARGLLARGKSNAGDVKAGSTGPPIWATLAMSGQVIGLSLPGFVYWTTVAYNKFRQPEWMIRYALPSPSDVFGLDGVVVGRLTGLLALLLSYTISHRALKALGNQFHGIGVSPPSFGAPHGGTVAYIHSVLQQIRKKHRLVDTGPYAYVRHPIYT